MNNSLREKLVELIKTWAAECEALKSSSVTRGGARPSDVSRAEQLACDRVGVIRNAIHEAEKVIKNGVDVASLNDLETSLVKGANTYERQRSRADWVALFGPYQDGDGEVGAFRFCAMGMQALIAKKP